MDEEARKARAKDKFVAERSALLKMTRQQTNLSHSTKSAKQPSNGAKVSAYGAASILARGDAGNTLANEIDKGPVDKEEIESLLSGKPIYMRPPPSSWQLLWTKLPVLSVVFFILIGLFWTIHLVMGWAINGDESTRWTISSTPPHVALFLVDDQGWNDIGYQSTDLFALTPTIDSLAADGIKLTSYYTMHTCTPARASLLTGLYTIHTGMQHAIITINYPYALPLDLAIMPQYFQAAGYKTAMMGKWHLGHFRHAHLPRARGFDDFVGFYSGFQDHFTHVSESTICVDECLMDLRSGIGENTPDEMISSEDYGPAIWRDAFDALISRHDSADPLFIYYAQSLVHQPVEVPEDILETNDEVLSSIPNEGRRTFAAMTIYLDSTFSSMVETLKAANMWENTVLVYASDNGGDPPAIGCGNNWPLRGRKANLYEGGVKVPAFVHSPLLPSSSRGITYDNMVSVTDWLPTLIDGVLGRKDLLQSTEIPGSTRQRSGLDGVNQWTQLLRGGGSLSSPSAPRKEILLNIDYLWGLDSTWQDYDTAAIIVGRWKLILKEVNETAWPTPTNSDNDFSRQPAIADGSGTDVFNWLFDLSDDPTESVNLYDDYPEKVTELRLKIAAYREGMVDALFCNTNDPASYQAQLDSGEGFLGPWVTQQLGDMGGFSCPSRTLSDGNAQLNYDPSFLDGNSYEGKGDSSSNYFGDDSSFPG